MSERELFKLKTGAICHLPTCLRKTVIARSKQTINQVLGEGIPQYQNQQKLSVLFLPDLGLWEATASRTLRQFLAGTREESGATTAVALGPSWLSVPAGL